ncbi:hypothetical protein SAMN04487868_104158 [Marinobacter salarius]|jgi:hypothetical protein|uniref:Uncharacterized protein n=1 Tax=Marinobacter salarius TaxID=1420917 RepID=A0ABY1FLI8_9GAMM|nr:hypothetical protein SAMN04487868_104158 [Marinobacter salarius]
MAESKRHMDVPKERVSETASLRPQAPKLQFRYLANSSRATIAR